MIEIEAMELGYTPNNLKAVKQKFSLTNKEIASITGISDVNNVSKWANGHAHMPYSKWLALLHYLTNK